MAYRYAFSKYCKIISGDSWKVGLTLVLHPPDSGKKQENKYI